jgi:glycosyltransferase involved in cell wall biosynthesis
MQVLHVAAGNLYGGVERILGEIARADARRRHAFALAFEGRLSGEIQAAGARVDIFGPARFSRPLSVWRARRRLHAQWDLGTFGTVVCHSPWSSALAAPVIPPGAHVLWVHDALDGRHWTDRRVRRRPPAMVIANSRYTAASVRRWLRAVPLSVVYAPVAPVHADAAVRERLRREMDAARDTAVVLIAARFEPWKGHAELLRAVSSIDAPWQVWIAGAPQRDREEALARELRALAGSLGIAGRVRFLGARTDVPRLLAAADIHCQPNTAPEPFGIAFVEALSAGVPVVTTRGGGASEIVTDACGVLVDPGDPPGLVAALRTLMTDPARRHAMGAAGRARARELCDPLSQIGALEATLERLKGAAA